MRVLMLSWEYPPYMNGGMGRHVVELVPILVALDRELELHLLTPDFAGAGSRLAQGRLTVHRIRVSEPTASDFYHGIQVANELFTTAARALHAEVGGFDLVHVHDWLLGFAARSLQQSLGVPLLATIHATERGRQRGYLSNELQRAIDKAEQQLTNEARHIITCSHTMREEVQRFFGVDPGRVTVIPNGIDVSRFDRLRDENLGRWRARYARAGERLVFNVGRLVYEKGADLLVEAAPIVLRQIPQAVFVIGGRGPLQGILEQRVRAMGLSDKVYLSGYLSDEERDRLFLLADCCVFPSRYEPFGIVALESMAAGTPVVVANTGGLGAVVSHEETGLTVYPDNVESLAWGIVRTLSDPQAAARRAARAYDYVRRHLSWHGVASSTLQVYRDVVGSTGA